MKYLRSFHLHVAAIGALSLAATGCRTMFEGTPFAPRSDNNAARLNYSVQQTERDLARMRARVEALERQSEQLEARLAISEGQAREVGRLRAELLEYRQDAKKAQVDIPQGMAVTVQKMLTDQHNKTIAEVQRIVSARPAASAKQSGYNHTVAPGQTLSLIAREYKCSVDAILKANNLKSADNIRVNQVLFIPAD